MRTNMGGRTTTLALAGDTMLGRIVAERLIADPAMPLVAPEVAERIASADAFVLNLECCISDRGARFPDPRKPFYFRAPPLAAERLAALGVSAVTLANNHALDYGPVALLDTLRHLEAAGITAVGAGADETAARTPQLVDCGRLRLRLVAFSDHPAAYAAGADEPGIAFADLRSGLPEWARHAARPGPDADAVLVTPHWGPNMVSRPLKHVRRAAEALVAAGATLVAGHSAHVFQGVGARVLFDLGDFLDDYAVDRELRNDLGLLWLVDLDTDAPRRIRALPLALDHCFTREASESEADWIAGRLGELSAPFGSAVERTDALIEVEPPRRADFAAR
jgi:poly-gamma-glutamate capsule biosynthesis protein CapA/YwtB (metallophosphatase superfamily)